MPPVVEVNQRVQNLSHPDYDRLLDWFKKVFSQDFDDFHNWTALLNASQKLDENSRSFEKARYMIAPFVRKYPSFFNRRKDHLIFLNKLIVGVSCHRQRIFQRKRLLGDGMTVPGGVDFLKSQSGTKTIREILRDLEQDFFLVIQCEKAPDQPFVAGLIETDAIRRFVKLRKNLRAEFSIPNELWLARIEKPAAQSPLFMSQDVDYQLSQHEDALLNSLEKVAFRGGGVKSVVLFDR